MAGCFCYLKKHKFYLYLILVLVIMYVTFRKSENGIPTSWVVQPAEIVPHVDHVSTEESANWLFDFTLSAYNKVSKELPHGKSWPSFLNEVFQVPKHISDQRITDYITGLKRELTKTYEEIYPNPFIEKKPRQKTGVRINLALIACYERKEEAITMLKSAAIFSQDSELHAIAFSDYDNILDLAKEILKLRWQINAAGWDMTFELHLEWFPPDSNWESMYVKCATQRLFFPSLLPHIDSLIYLDTDIVVLSNLTEFYSHFKIMNNTQIAAAAANNEPSSQGWYRDGKSQVPFYGTHGLNAGVMLMNLTLMRQFRMQERCVAANTLYKDKIYLADQDIYNIIFHEYPELLHQLSCTYNFNWVHCGYPSNIDMFHCVDDKGEHVCWCRGLDETGLHIIHGNSGSFADQYFHFLPAIYEGFKTFDISKDSPVDLIDQLESDYESKPQDVCHRLTSYMLYSNAKSYFYELYEGES